MTSVEFAQVQAAAIDGRMHTIYHRQEQLERLCKTLIDHVNEIKDAISSDYGHSPAEIAVEYHLALTTIKKYYAQLKPKEAHDKEYFIANGKDAGDRRVPVGIVYIEPTLHTIFYSVVVPLAAAFATGNCCIVLVSLKYWHHLRGAELLTDLHEAGEQPTNTLKIPETDTCGSSGRRYLCYCFFPDQRRQAFEQRDMRFAERCPRRPAETQPADVFPSSTYSSGRGPNS